MACVVVLAARDLAHRAMPARIGTFQVATWAYLALVPAGACLMAVMGQSCVMPTPAQWLGLSGALVMGLFGYYAVVAAMRLGEVSVVAPYRYTRPVSYTHLDVYKRQPLPRTHLRHMPMIRRWWPGWRS